MQIVCNSGSALRIFWIMTSGLHFPTDSDRSLLLNSVSQRVETLWSSTHNGQPKVKWDMILVTRNHPHKINMPTKARHWGTSLCQVHLPSAWCMARRLRVTHNIHLGVEHVGDTVLLPSKGQEAFSWRWPGPLNSKFCSCASASDGRLTQVYSQQKATLKPKVCCNHGWRKLQAWT